MGCCLTNIIPVFLPEDGINIPLMKKTKIFELGMFLSQRIVFIPYRIPGFCKE